MTRLLIVDAHALLHRAFHAMPPLTRPDGQPSGAIYGFFTTLYRLHTDLSITHVVVAFDRPKPTFRKKLFANYQVQRPPMDTSLATQITMTTELLTRVGFTHIGCDGYEADDVIGTIVSKSENGELKMVPADANAMAGKNGEKIEQIIIATGDRDIMQLVVDDKVLVYMPTKGLSEAKLYDEAGVQERLGVPPRLIPDWKALAGDASDNYPGVAGIGPKRAVSLLNEFGDLAGIYAVVHDTSDARMKQSLRELLLKEEANAKLFYEIATIHRKAPITLDVTQLTWPAVNETTIAAFTEFGFNSLLKRIRPVATKTESAEPPAPATDKEQLTLL